MEDVQYKMPAEGVSREIMTVLSSIKDLLLLTGYCGNSPETTNYLSLVSICITRLQQITENAKNNVVGPCECAGRPQP